LALDGAAVLPDDAAVDDELKPFEWLIGTWQGTAEGAPGKGQQTRRYELILRGRFVMGTNRTTWEKTASHPEGEIHEDISLISWDRAAKRFVMHVFYVERFVAEHFGEQLGPDVWRFTSERVQNGPAGMRSRETFERRDGVFVSRFELASANEDFALYTTETLRKI
jgi:hypothetical protein